MTLNDVCHLQGINLNLLSLSRMLKQGWKMSATEESIIMRKVSLKICFDLVIQPKHGALYCAYFSCNRRMQGGALINGVQMSIMMAHAILGHGNELATRKKAKYLGWEISQGALKTCKSCAIGKARQKKCAKRKQRKEGKGK